MVRSSHLILVQITSVPHIAPVPANCRGVCDTV
jgi:hypothetical protein